MDASLDAEIGSLELKVENPAVAGGTIDAWIPFSNFCLLLDKINSLAGRPRAAERKRNLIDSYFSLYRSKWGPNDSLYPIARLLLPALDRERTAYGIKEQMIAKHYIEKLAIPKGSEDYQRLMGWKKPEVVNQRAGDFASVVALVLRNRVPSKGMLTVKDINDALDELSNANALQDREKAKNVLIRLLLSTTPEEQKWLVRIILKDLKISIGDKTVLGCLHPDAYHLYSTTSSLKEVCDELKDVNKRIAEREVSLFRPFKPQLSERARISEVPGKMGRRPFVMEIKYDGDRMQMHKDGDTYKWFSRNAKDFTDIYGGDPQSGGLTRFIHGAFKKHIKRLILDGEMIGYNPEDGSYVSKGLLDVKVAKGEDGDENAIRQCFVVFDVLLINDESLGKLPLHERFDRLRDVFEPVTGRMVVSERRVGETVQDVIEAINAAIDSQEEGIVIKDPQAPYQCDAREGSGWLKIKPEYVDVLADSLDLLIIGGYHATGLRRGGLVSHFLLGLAVPPEATDDEPSLECLAPEMCGAGATGACGEGASGGGEAEDDPMMVREGRFDADMSVSDGEAHESEGRRPPPPNKLPTEFWSATKVGTGYTMHELQQLLAHLEPHWIPYDTHRPPACIKLADGFKEKPDFWIHPSHSRIVQIKAAEIIPSDRFAVGYTLRFPRLERIRYDKEWYEAMDVTQFDAMRRTSNGRLATARFREGDDDGDFKEKRRKIGRGAVGVAEQFRMADLRDVEIQSTAFDGMEFCVVSDGAMKKADMERAVAAHGGKCVANPTETTDIVVVGRMTMPARLAIDRACHDVVTEAWLEDSLREGVRMPLQPKYLLNAKEKTRDEILATTDRFGDSFTDDATEASLRSAFSLVGRMHRPAKGGEGFWIQARDCEDESLVYAPPETLSSTQIMDIEQEHFGGSFDRIGLFRGWRFYVDDCTVVGDQSTRDPLSPLSIVVRRRAALYGAQMVDDVPDATHVIVSADDNGRVPAIRDALRRMERRPRLVTADWVEQSIGEATVLPEERFAVPAHAHARA